MDETAQVKWRCLGSLLLDVARLWWMLWEGWNVVDIKERNSRARLAARYKYLGGVFFFQIKVNS
jgi:hypothetical protein